MFVTNALPFVIARATLKIEPNEDGIDRRVADLSLVFEPFPYAIAAEMDFALSEHLFTSSQQIRPELETVTLDPRAGLQRITVQSVPDAPVLATLNSARILELKVTKKDDPKNNRQWLKAALLVQIDLGERAVREFLFHHFGEVRCFTFLPEQLPMDTEPTERRPEVRH